MAALPSDSSLQTFISTLVTEGSDKTKFLNVDVVGTAFCFVWVAVWSSWFQRPMTGNVR